MSPCAPRPTPPSDRGGLVAIARAEHWVDAVPWRLLQSGDRRRTAAGIRLRQSRRRRVGDARHSDTCRERSRLAYAMGPKVGQPEGGQTARPRVAMKNCAGKRLRRCKVPTGGARSHECSYPARSAASVARQPWSSRRRSSWANAGHCRHTLIAGSENPDDVDPTWCQVSLDGEPGTVEVHLVKGAGPATSATSREMRLAPPDDWDVTVLEVVQ